MAHADSVIIKIAIAYMDILTSGILDLSNSFHNTNVNIHEIFYVIPPLYYLEWFEKSYPNVPLNLDESKFCL